MMPGAGDCDYPEEAYDSDGDFDSTEWEPLDDWQEPEEITLEDLASFLIDLTQELDTRS